MWDQSYDAGGGGGFMTASQGGGTPAGKGGNRRRTENVVPVRVDDVLHSTGETLTVEGQDVSMVVLVGQVKSVENAATKSIYRLEDKSGAEIECIHWSDDSADNTANSITENMFCRVVGSVRVNQEKRTVMVFKISVVADTLEVDAHELEVAHARLKIRQCKEKENASIGANTGGATSNAGLSNSMMGGFASNNQASSSNNFGNAKHDMVYKMVQSCQRDEGINRDELLTQLKAKMSRQDIDSSLDFLSGEGHIYSTIDDDHFKAIDG